MNVDSFLRFCVCLFKTNSLYYMINMFQMVICYLSILNDLFFYLELSRSGTKVALYQKKIHVSLDLHLVLNPRLQKNLGIYQIDSSFSSTATWLLTNFEYHHKFFASFCVMSAMVIIVSCLQWLLLCHVCNGYYCVMSAMVIIEG